MSKLQELLDKHKGELWNGGFGQLTAHIKAGVNCKGIRADCQGVTIEGRGNYTPTTSFSLNDLIFGTQFIRLLQWNDIYFDMKLHGDLVYHDRTVKTTHKLTVSGYILCRLAIMDTDEERLKFIENNTHL